MNINEALNLLNISDKATKEEIKKAYKKMAIKFHPDRNPAGAEVMKAINAAFEFLNSLESEEFTHTDTENAYNFAEELAEIIAELQKLQGVIIEVCGNWIWLTGETRQYKEKLKELGCYWAAKKLNGIIAQQNIKAVDTLNRGIWKKSAINTDHIFKMPQTVQIIN